MVQDTERPDLDGTLADLVVEVDHMWEGLDRKWWEEMRMQSSLVEEKVISFDVDRLSVVGWEDDRGEETLTWVEMGEWPRRAEEVVSAT